jgi:hypothetical protein
MRLKGSCHCQTVSFAFDSHTPQPYMRCYCSICRKTAGGGGYAINIMGRHDSLEIKGREQISVYQVTGADGVKADHHRHFCALCGSALWVWCPRWPDLFHPFASAIDSDLPAPHEFVNIMLDSAATWSLPAEGGFGEYPENSIEDWHRDRGLLVD